MNSTALSRPRHLLKCALARFAMILFGLVLAAPHGTGAPLPAPISAPLPAPVASALKSAGIPPGAVGIWVQEVGSREPRLNLNGRQAMNPASVMKLLTTWGALESLGPAYTWTTGAWASAPVENGVLKGDLYLKGSGDPKLTLERFWLLLHQLRERGVQEIRGDLALDRSLFAVSEQATAFDDQPMRPYNVGPDALLLNFKALRLSLNTEGAGPTDARKVSLQAEPRPENLEIINLIKVGNGPCGDFKEGLRSDLVRSNSYQRLVLTGVYAANCGERVWNLGVMAHDDYVWGVFRQLWHELGGEISGGLRNAPLPADARLLAQSESPALAEIVRDINKFSNNVMARQLLLALANSRPATPEDGARNLQRLLSERGIAAPELVLENGSGLSRRERISPATLASLLLRAWDSPLMPEFVSSLPLTAVDGTMKKRLTGRSSAGQSHIKTGTLEGVKSIAGYVHGAGGRPVVVVFLVNHPNAAAAQGAQDALLQWVYDGFSAPPGERE